MKLKTTDTTCHNDVNERTAQAQPGLGVLTPIYCATPCNLGHLQVT